MTVSHSRNGSVADLCTGLEEPAAPRACEQHASLNWLEAKPSNHFVHIYEGDAALVEAVSVFVGSGIGAGDAAIIIATNSHRAAIETKLKARGFDLEAIRTRGQYVSLDAVAALAKFMVGGLPDEKLFNETIGTLVARLSNGRGLRAFGEMVALLWEDDNRSAAIRLEQLWNDLGRRHAFSLFCAYPLETVRGVENSDSFVQICNEHTRVIPTEKYMARNEADRLRAIALLQQKAASLEAEIEQRKSVEAALLQSQEELKSLLENAPLALHWVGAEGIIKWANRAELDLFGYSKSEYVGHHISEFHVSQETIADILSRLTRGENIQNREAAMKCKDGSIKYVSIDSSVLWRGGKFIHTQCFTRDITDTKRTAELRQRLAAIVESSDDAIISKDLNGIINSWNQGAERIFGYTAEEIIGKPLLTLIPTERHHEEVAIIERLRRGERIDHFETVRQRKDGELLDISLTISPIRDASGKVVGASKIARDITERKRVEKALRELTDRLARSNEELERRVEERTASLREAVAQMEEFSYSVSHDLRAPLRAMQGYCHILMEDCADKLGRDELSYLKRIASSAERLDRLVQDVLAYSRISRIEMDLKPLELEDLISDVIRHYAAEHSPSPDITVVKPLLSVRGHEPSMVQCLSNLVSNALKFVPPGRTPRIRIWTEAKGETVRLWIEDNGIGIDPNHQEKIFNIFERVPDVCNIPGTGVGLAIVKKAIHRMQGEVGVESALEKGSRFWIRLPKAD